MKVLLSGAFGNVGESTLKELLKKGYDVRCFDLKNPRNARIRNKLSKYGIFEVIWGDIRDKETVCNLVQGVDCIIHLASIIPPLAYERPKLAFEVNVQGTKNLINAAEKMENPPKFIYSSSIAVHGNTMNKKPPTKINDSFKPLDYDNYAKHKIEIEQTLWASRLPWIILRFAAITPFDMKWDIPDIMFEIPLKQRIEIADTRDVGLACSNAVEADKINANAVTSVKINANAVTAVKIQALAVEAGKIAANAVEASTVKANAITAVKIKLRAFTATFSIVIIYI